MDDLLFSIKYKNIKNTVISLTELYSKLIIYTNAINYEEYKNLLITKYNLLLAYSIIDTENWTLIHDYILISSKHMYKIINLNDIDKYKQYNINQAYVAIKEMENLINIRNKYIFFLKYKIALDKLENL